MSTTIRRGDDRAAPDAPAWPRTRHGDGTCHLLTSRAPLSRRYVTRVIYETVWPSQPERSPFDGVDWILSDAEARALGLDDLDAVHAWMTARFDSAIAAFIDARLAAAARP